jgi:hypothetical protein
VEQDWQGETLSSRSEFTTGCERLDSVALPLAHVAFSKDASFP